MDVLGYKCRMIDTFTQIYYALLEMLKMRNKPYK